jgi:hypothetical protein
MEARSGQQPVFAARPKLQADFGDVVGWLEAKPGKRLVVSGSLSCHGHHALEARTIHSLPLGSIKATSIFASFPLPITTATG